MPKSKRNSKIYSMSIVALFSALMCILGPLSIPVGPIPIAFANLIIMLSIYILDSKQATLSCVIYIIIGLIGLPVFSNYMSGVGALIGPTGGYIIGYIPMVIVSSLIVRKHSSKALQFIGIFVGLVINYLIGTIWFSIFSQVNLLEAILVCIAPFIIFDIIKIVSIVTLGNLIRKRIL